MPALHPIQSPSPKSCTFTFQVVSAGECRHAGSSARSRWRRPEKLWQLAYTRGLCIIMDCEHSSEENRSDTMLSKDTALRRYVTAGTREIGAYC